MGMGYGAGYADVISLNKIKKVCPAETKAFLSKLKESKVDLDDFARLIAYEEDLSIKKVDDEEASKIQGELVDLWTTLQTAFHKQSEGLTLEIGHHDSDNDGDRYDEIDGAFFSVGGMYQLTPAGKKFQRAVKRQFFVTYG